MVGSGKEVEAQSSNFLLYTGADGGVHVEVVVQDETLWLTQKNMAQLFDVGRPGITKHLKKIFESNELDEKSVCSILEHTAADGKRYKTQYYNLDTIIAVGYRVNSKQATQFRIWATQALKEYIIKGFILDDQRLKQGSQAFGQDYFDELLERIRDIRASERRFYQKITDLYAQCSLDYDPKAETTHSFYATVQNKLHWAIHGHTAPELIVERVDAGKPNMGLTNWKNGPQGPVRKHDAETAKNYLSQEELSQLNRVVSMYLDFAEDQVRRKKEMTMKDWAGRLDAFLQFNEYEVLQNAGKIKATVAKALAHGEYDKFRQERDVNQVSDFDQLVQDTKMKGKT